MYFGRNNNARVINPLFVHTFTLSYLAILGTHAEIATKIQFLVLLIKKIHFTEIESL